MSYCVICGKPEDAHHEFQARRMPAGCVCEPWAVDPVPPVCKQYQGDGRFCEDCEHDKACHAKAKP